MMAPYPFFGFPPFRRPYPYYNNYNVHNANFSYNKNSPNYSVPSDFLKNRPENNSHNLKNSTGSVNNSSVNDNSDKCFEIFGLKLYFDDLLIIALLFFLYQEDVKDSYLYTALILLLLS